MKDAGVQITEMNSGCICCTLVGDFKAALEKVIKTYAPDRIIIEPSGVGKLSDVARAVSAVAEKAEIGAKVTVVDANKCKMYIRNFGEFFNDQVKNADVIVLSRTSDVGADKIAAAAAMLKELNGDAVIITTPWDKLTGGQFIEAMEHRSTLAAALAELEDEHEHHHDDDDDDDDDDEHDGHHHDHGDACECGCHDHAHHHGDDDDDDDDDDDEHEGHHHDHGDTCECGCHDHDHEHHHHHHADEVFTSWGSETPRKFTEAELKTILTALDDTEKYGMILRAKGMVDASDGQWLYFDYVPGEANIRRGAPIVTGRFCVIGSKSTNWH